MPDPHHPLHASILRIADAHDAIIGAGFLAAPWLVCTCAHVVADALGISRDTVSRPTTEVRLDFPFLDEAHISASVEVWVPIEPDGGGGDIAVLRLTSDPPPGARPARLLPVSNLSGRDFAAYGFPSTTDVGQWAYGILRDPLTKNGWVQMEGTTTVGYRVQRGYSGTPVWDQRGRGVVGMVVAEDRAPEAKVAFLMPNDLLQRACPDIKLVTIHQLFAPLTDGLAGLPGSPLSGVEQFLREYLGTPEAPTPFGGRQLQLEELDQWLADPAHPYALLVAEAGRGKSALLAHWVVRVADARRAEVVFVPISIRFSTALKTTTLGLLRSPPAPSEQGEFPCDPEEWLAEIERYLREDRSIDRPVLIVLDGVDEATDWTVERDLRLPPEPGRGIKVLVSARTLADCDATGWMRRLEWQGQGVPLTLPLLDQASVADVLRQMGFPLDRLGARVDVIAELYRLSDQGNPLLVRLYIDDLWQRREVAARLQPEDLQAIPPGLPGYFKRWWQDQQQQWELQGLDPLREREDTLDFFNLCATALGPLSRDEVAAIAGSRLASGLWLQAIVSAVGRFIIGDGQTQGYTFSHPRLGYYFREEQMTEQGRREWGQRFLDFGQRTLAALDSDKLNPRQAPPYIVRYYGAHLQRAGAGAEHYYALVNAGWLQAWEALEGTYDGFLNDMVRAWRLAEAAGEQEQHAADRGRAIGLQCRYALIMASIKSLVSHIPPALLTVLIDNSVWTPVRGLAYARQMPEEKQRAEALVELASYLPEPLLREALAVARAIADAENRAGALTGLAPYLSEPLRGTALQEALAAARAIAEEEEAQLRVLVGLAPYLPEPLPTSCATR